MFIPRFEPLSYINKTKIKAKSKQNQSKIKAKSKQKKPGRRSAPVSLAKST